MDYEFKKVDKAPLSVDEGVVYYNDTDITFYCKCGCKNIVELNADFSNKGTPTFIVINNSIIPSFNCPAGTPASVDSGNFSLL